MRGRSGRRRIFGSRVVVVLGIGALALLLAMRMRRRAVEDTSGYPRGASTQEDDTQEPTESIRERGREKATDDITQDTEGTDGSGEEIRRDKDPVRLGPLKGQPMMSVIRRSVRRSRGGA
jgi:hypothetical protein